MSQETAQDRKEQFRRAFDDTPFETSGDGTEPPPGSADDYGRAAMSDDEDATPDSDIALAGRWVQMHGQNWRHVKAWGWMHWTGQRWARDDEFLIRAVCVEVCAAAAAGAAARSNDRRRLASAKTVRDVEYLAQATDAARSTTDRWDRDPWLLNTPGGTIELKSGALIDHDAGNYITRMTAVAPGGNCPLWHVFLDRVTAGDLELQAYLQRMAGYMLTGSIEEHAMFFAHGTGGNGKGCFMTTLSGILGDYARTAPLDTFMESHNDRHPTELAMLAGARLVTVPEVEKGRRWAESKLKTLTGGDPIAARFMHKDHFEFTPQFKLLVSGNHKPALRTVDPAMRRRLNLLPFTVEIGESERDPKLPEKLRAEWSGILAWMIDGCLDWQRERLNPPATVRMATEAYMESQDTIAAWLDECCERDPNAWTPRSELWASYEPWAKRNGDHVGSAASFYGSLENRGLERVIRRGVRGFAGLAIGRGAGGCNDS